MVGGLEVAAATAAAGGGNDDGDSGNCSGGGCRSVGGGNGWVVVVMINILNATIFRKNACILVLLDLIMNVTWLAPRTSRPTGIIFLTTPSATNWVSQNNSLSESSGSWEPNLKVSVLLWSIR